MNFHFAVHEFRPPLIRKNNPTTVSRSVTFASWKVKRWKKNPWKFDKCIYHTCQVIQFVTFLGWWKRDPFKGLSMVNWPPTGKLKGHFESPGVCFLDSCVLFQLLFHLTKKTETCVHTDTLTRNTSWRTMTTGLWPMRQVLFFVGCFCSNGTSDAKPTVKGIRNKFRLRQNKWRLRPPRGASKLSSEKISMNRFWKKSCTTWDV